MDGRRSLLSSLTFKKVLGMIFWPPKLVKFFKSLYLNANYQPIPVEEVISQHRQTLVNFNALLVSLPAPAGSLSPIEHKDYTQPSTSLSADASRLNDLFRRYGSDKSTKHNYHEVYAQILGPLQNSSAHVLEIGLGTPNIDVPSNMGERGHPGASVRAFRDFLPQGLIFGADVDRRILFAEERLQTFYVDQTRWEALMSLANSLPPQKFDLIIDDGLHMPHANLNTLRFALALLKPTGVFIIEDVARAENPVWEMVGQHLQARGYRCQLIHTRGSSDMFAVIGPQSPLAF